ncbi:glycosyltransferase family 39 protein [candidate division KSB1 bacterium]|nr:glycosyltransferase family 39 protein [candidate division KSB1 bacterium]
MTFMNKNLFYQKIKNNPELSILFLVFVITVPLLLTPWVYTEGAADYSWVRSFIMDGDLDCSNEFEYYGKEFQQRYGWAGITYDLFPLKTATGIQANKYSIGSAFLWSPFFLVGHFFTIVFTDLPADGYSKIYVLFVSFASCLYAFLGILLGYLIAKRFFPARIVLFAAIGIWFASSIPVYMYLNPSMPHNASMFAVSLFLFYWVKTLHDRSSKQWLVLGLLAGLMMMVRMENLMFTICPLLESLNTYYQGYKQKDKAKIKKLLLQNVVFVLFLIVGFSPQMVVWKIVFGKFFVQPYDIHQALINTAQNLSAITEPGVSGAVRYPAIISFLRFFTHPHLGQTLWGSSHGIFTWTPIILFSFLGFIWLIQKEKKEGVIIFVALIVIVYVTSCSFKGGSSFGDRYLLKCTSIYIIGLSALIYRFKKQLRETILIAILFLFILWNGMFIVQYSTGLVPRIGPISWSQMIKNQFFAAPQKLIYFAKPFLLGRDSVYNVKKQQEEVKDTEVRQ